ncbi:MAG: hypothetical protein WCW36_01770 [Candidatus Paceibacterota bacterium]
MKSIFIKNRAVITSILVTVTASILYAALTLIFTNPLTAVWYILVFSFYNFVIPHSLSIAVLVCTGIFVHFVFSRNRFFSKLNPIGKSLMLILILVSAGLGIFLFFKHSSCELQQIRTLTYFEPIVIDSSGNYTTSNVMAREIGKGLSSILMEPIGANDIATTTNDRESVRVEDFPQYLLNFNSIKKTDSEHLAWNIHTCSGVINWLEFDSNGYLVDVHVSNTLPFLISNTDFDSAFNVKDRFNRLVFLHVLETNESKGVYMGRIYKALLESMNAAFYSNQGDIKDSLAVIELGKAEIEKLNGYLLTQASKIPDSSQRQKAIGYIRDDYSMWMIESDYLKHYTYADNGDFSDAENSLRDAFRDSFKVSKSYEDILGSFEKEYFQSLNGEVPNEDDFLVNIRRNGYIDNITPQSIYISLFFALIDYNRINENFDYNSFFEWLNKSDSNNPVIYMFWGKMLTLHSKFIEGAQKYAIAYSIFPNAPILGLFEQVAYINFYTEGNDIGSRSVEQIKQELDLHMEKISEISSELQKKGFDITNHDTCSTHPGLWSRWCANSPEN